MPAFGATLGDGEIAAVLTHIRSQWGIMTQAQVHQDAQRVVGIDRELHGARKPREGSGPSVVAVSMQINAHPPHHRSRP